MPDCDAYKIDFEEWSALARSDPDAFEARRRQAIEALIQSAPAHRQERLRGLQWRIDQIRRTSKTPLAACLRISQLMWDSVYGRGGLLETLARLSGKLSEKTPPPTARILKFIPRRDCGARAGR